MAVIREANTSTHPRVGPMDPNGVMPISIDINTWLNGETLSQYAFTLPAELDIGDGVKTTGVSPAETVTPLAPAVASNVITFYVFEKTGQTLTLEQDYEVTVHVTTTVPRADDLTVKFKIQEK